MSSVPEMRISLLKKCDVSAPGMGFKYCPIWNCSAPSDSRAEANLSKRMPREEPQSLKNGSAPARLGTTAADPAHSAGEQRHITVGLSSSGRLLVVAHAERGDRIRIIRARTLTAKEKRAYENTQE